MPTSSLSSARERGEMLMNNWKQESWTGELEAPVPSLAAARDPVDTKGYIKAPGRLCVCSWAVRESVPRMGCCPEEDGQFAHPASRETKTRPKKGCKAKRLEDSHVVVHLLMEKLNVLWETPAKPNTRWEVAESEIADKVLQVFTDIHRVHTLRGQGQQCHPY